MECGGLSGDDWAKPWAIEVWIIGIWIKNTTIETKYGASGDNRSFISVLLRWRFTHRSLLEIENMESSWPASHLEDSEDRGRVLALENLHGDIVHGNAGGGLAIRGAMMGVTVKHNVSAVTIDHLGKTRTA